MTEIHEMENVMVVEITYILYLMISIAITVGVARTLSKNGLVFLVDGFGGNERLAVSVNHMLVVGFYLLNLGFVTLALRYGTVPVDTQTAIEFLSTKIGIVLLVLGAIHMLNLSIINRIRMGYQTQAESRDRLEKALERKRQSAGHA